MQHVLDIVPYPRKPLKALALALLFWMVREATFPLREKSLKGKVALITGGGGGIGRLMGLRLAKDGATVILWDVNLDAAQKVANEIKAAGGKAGAYKVDVSDRNIVYAVAEQTLKDWNRVDILINNAGTRFPRNICRLGSNNTNAAQTHTHTVLLTCRLPKKHEYRNR
jgi:NADP-dependent 3-hydroxy acid dehydrogenase YdfG